MSGNDVASGAGLVGGGEGDEAYRELGVRLLHRWYGELVRIIMRDGAERAVNHATKGGAFKEDDRDEHQKTHTRG